MWTPQNHPNNLPFNPKPATIMLMDINSCFATIEQQANPLLRGKPVAVAAYNTPNGCILAASYDAKRLGVKTGMHVKEGKLLCPNLTVLTPDPQKYRDVHLKLKALLQTYSSVVIPKSIDEFIIDLEGFPSLSRGITNVALEIKQRIKKEVGDYITVSIGIGPNRYLAKVASGLQKPDGLVEIHKDNYLQIFSGMELMDLCGIKRHNAARLGAYNIYSVMDFYNADAVALQQAFQSIVGYHWYLRLHGWEIDDVEFGRHSYGNSYALPKPFSKMEDLAPIMYKLVDKTARRLRKASYKTKGIHVSVTYRDGSFWHHGHVVGKALFDSRDIYKEVFRILCKSPYKGKPVALLAESCFDLVKSDCAQMDMFEDVEKKERLNDALDNINDKFGEFVITPGRLIDAVKYVQDRISFGGVKDLE